MENENKQKEDLVEEKPKENTEENKEVTVDKTEEVTSETKNENIQNKTEEIKNLKKKKRSKKVNPILVVVVCSLLLLVGVGIVFYVVNPFADDKKQTEVIDEQKENKEVSEKLLSQKEIWKQNKAINSDYVGQLVFESGLINQPVLQGSDNNVYFRTNWKDMSHDEEGTVFMDYRNEPDDQNTIIYGHYVYPSYETGTLGLKEATGTRMFTPLVKLKDQNNYEANKYVDLYLENEVRRYEVAVVYHCQLDPEVDYVSPVENMYYFLTNYDEEYFEKYKSTIYENAFYKTGVDINYNDKLLTLQTCVEGRDDLLEIVVCKEVSRTVY